MTFYYYTIIMFTNLINLKHTRSLFTSKYFLQLATLMQLLADVDTSDKFTVHVYLWICRPVGKLLEAFTDLLILVDVEAAVLDTLCGVLIEQVDDPLAEPTLRLLRRSLHEEHDFLLIDQFLQPLLECLHN